MALDDKEVELLANIYATVKVLESHLIGNGNPGLVVRVAKLEEQQNRWLGAFAAISLFIGSIVGLVVYWVNKQLDGGA